MTKQTLESLIPWTYAYAVLIVERREKREQLYDLIANARAKNGR